jgi:hypothetical protein
MNVPANGQTGEEYDCYVGDADHLDFSVLSNASVPNPKTAHGGHK